MCNGVQLKQSSYCLQVFCFARLSLSCPFDQREQAFVRGFSLCALWCFGQVIAFPLIQSGIHETKGNPREPTVLLSEFRGPLKICFLFSSIYTCVCLMYHVQAFQLYSAGGLGKIGTFPSFRKQSSSAMLTTLACLNTCCMFVNMPRELSALLKSLFSDLMAYGLYDVPILLCHYPICGTSLHPCSYSLPSDRVARHLFVCLLFLSLSLISFISTFCRPLSACPRCCDLIIVCTGMSRLYNGPLLLKPCADSQRTPTVGQRFRQNFILSCYVFHATSLLVYLFFNETILSDLFSRSQQAQGPKLLTMQRVSCQTFFLSSVGHPQKHLE